jgi:hypothetical protein
MASQPVTVGTRVGMAPILVGKVTLVRYECVLQGTSGQEENREHSSFLIAVY